MFEFEYDFSEKIEITPEVSEVLSYYDLDINNLPNTVSIIESSNSINMVEIKENIGYIDFNNFNNSRDIQAAFYLIENTKGLILNFYNSKGNCINNAGLVLSFLQTESIDYIKNDKKITLDLTNDFNYNKPIVILIDNYTESTGLFVAKTLYDKCTVIGYESQDIFIKENYKLNTSSIIEIPNIKHEYNTTIVIPHIIGSDGYNIALKIIKSYGS